MGWLILAVIVILATGFGLGFYIIGERYDKQLKWKLRKRQLLSLIGLILFLPAFIGSVPVNSVGILYSPFSGVSEDTLDEGIHIKNPLEKIYDITTQIQTVTVEGIVTQTGDSQFLSSSIDIKYSVNPANAFMVFTKFKTLDYMNTSFIPTTTKRVLESITTQYNIIDILGVKRNEINLALSAQLKDEFEKYGISFDSVTIKDSDAGENIEAAIAAEAVAKKQVETAEQELLKVQTEAKQKTVQAQAEKDAANIKAETKIIEAQAIADANKIINDSLTDKVLLLKLYETWNGNPSQVVLGESGSPFIFDMNSLNTSDSKEK